MRNQVQKMIKSTNKAEIFGFGSPGDSKDGTSAAGAKFKQLEAKNASKKEILDSLK